MSVMVSNPWQENFPSPGLSGSRVCPLPDFDQRGPFQCLDEAIERIHMGYKFMIFPEAPITQRGLGKFNAGPSCLQAIERTLQPLFCKNDPPFLPKEDKWYFLPPGSQPLRSNSGSPWLHRRRDRSGVCQESGGSIQEGVGLTLKETVVWMQGKWSPTSKAFAPN